MDKIVVYTKNNCFPCKMTKRYLKEHGIDFTEKNIDNDLKALEFLMEQGVKQAPAIFVNDHLYLTGFNPSMLHLLGGENMDDGYIYEYNVLVRDITTSIGYNFIFKAATFQNALNTLKLQYEDIVGNDFTNADMLIMNRSIYDVIPPE